MEQESEGSSIDRSNLNLIVKKGLEIAEKPVQLLVSRDFTNKQRLQYLVFPMGILYNLAVYQSQYANF